MSIIYGFLREVEAYRISHVVSELSGRTVRYGNYTSRNIARKPLPKKALESELVDERRSCKLESQ